MTAEATEFIYTYTRPPLYAEQEAAIFTPARYSLIEASTKSGKTLGCLAWLFEQAAVQGGPIVTTGGSHPSSPRPGSPTAG